ncbi:antimicrobial peptide Alo-3-like [Leptopilina heterotoma]|uniref:antimicrobial peptide Alo-3-like n=1 Tax=Leptopilina heterotoma TaxID=63436 RepID=UPI001CA96746|nr:antimicrobial peptide Alo-3-like [Leptopilina heterotoma]
MAALKSILFLMLLSIISFMIVPSAMGCIERGGRCKENGQGGLCCRGTHCHREPGRVWGSCRR